MAPWYVSLIKGFICTSLFSFTVTFVHFHLPTFLTTSSRTSCKQVCIHEIKKKMNTEISCSYFFHRQSGKQLFAQPDPCPSTNKKHVSLNKGEDLFRLIVFARCNVHSQSSTNILCKANRAETRSWFKCSRFTKMTVQSRYQCTTLSDSTRIAESQNTHPASFSLLILPGPARYVGLAACSFSSTSVSSLSKNEIFKIHTLQLFCLVLYAHAVALNSLPEL